MANYQPAMLQDLVEIDRLVDIALANDVRSYLEIGSKYGGSLWRIGSALPKGSFIVAVDIPAGTKAWPESERSLKDCVNRLNAMGHDAHLIWGDSTDPRVVAQVEAVAPFDLCLIDANHTKPYLEKDWANYGQMAKIVAFHDISWHRAPEWVGHRIDVPEFWAKIKGDYFHEEIRRSHKDNGIGVLWRSR